MRKSSLVAVALAAFLAAPVAFSADEAAPAHAKSHFDTAIDTWAEGVVMAIDADAGSITVRGVKRPYATAYATMLKEIADETSRLTGDAAVQKENEIRAKHADTLAKARVAETADKDSDFTFYLPKEKNRVSFFNETHLYDRDASAKASTEVKTTDAEKQALMTFRDLKVGDRVSIGYDAGVVYNNAHAIVKVREASADAVKPVKASLKSETTEPSAAPSTSVVQSATQKAKDATRLDAETENARQIRKALVADESLSVKAKNVVIVQENGTFTLKGFVDSEAEKASVEKKAANVVGQERVVNQIEIAK